MSVEVSAAFDAGNIRLVSADGDAVRLEIVTDHGSDFYQWFHFRALAPRGTAATYEIVNAGGSAYPDGWPGYRARWSTDRATWRQVADTDYADGVLRFRHVHDVIHPKTGNRGLGRIARDGILADDFIRLNDHEIGRLGLVPLLTRSTPALRIAISIGRLRMHDENLGF